MIELKNIDLSNVTVQEQLNKVEEEEKEFMEAIGEMSVEHIIEEFWDEVQAKIGLMYMLGISTKKVEEGYKEHIEKLSHRPR